MSIVIRKIKGIPIAYNKKELCPMLDDIYVDYDIVEAILHMFYKNGTVLKTNDSISQLKEFGLVENAAWKKKTIKERNRIIAQRLELRRLEREKVVQEKEEEKVSKKSKHKTNPFY